ncbi:conserved Plasmodium protein, unknown function [Plasmodium gallinaceum]|uniref:Uncharacterized protein n=1 Tax=Plasmodium gallinaceum TaxID=5849 RepID=A0A1J1H3Z0_PLAGA|nr:conserved Plasmodium protein, unknown function [Plasmodium gallinaceum]CRG98199.1 conserved Plasmodium protein, unknown function [Plasmodium gallinaceum]
MAIMKNSLKTLNNTTKKLKNIDLLKYKNNFYNKFKELNEISDKEIDKERIILRSYLFKKEEAYLNEKDISKILNKIIKKRIKNEYIWSNIKNLIFKFNLKYINDYSSHNENNNKSLTYQNKELFYYNKNFDHINVYLLAIAIQVLNKRNANLFNFLFIYLKYFCTNIEPRHFLHIFLILVKNTYRDINNLSKSKSLEEVNKFNNDNKNNNRSNTTLSYLHTIKEIYADKIICSEKNFIELLSRYCIDRINFFSFNDISLICESLCYFSLKENPFSDYWNIFLFYIFEINTKNKNLSEFDKENKDSLLYARNNFFKKYEHSGLFIKRKIKTHDENKEYNKYIELSGKNILSILKYIHNYYIVYPEIKKLAKKIKIIFLKYNFDVTLYECSEILYYFNLLNELNIKIIKDKINIYEYQFKNVYLSFHDLNCLLKLSELYQNYSKQIAFLNIFLHNIHKFSIENVEMIFKLIFKDYEYNLLNELEHNSNSSITYLSNYNDTHYNYIYNYNFVDNTFLHDFNFSFLYKNNYINCIKENSKKDKYKGNKLKQFSDNSSGYINLFYSNKNDLNYIHKNDNYINKENVSMDWNGSEFILYRRNNNKCYYDNDTNNSNLLKSLCILFSSFSEIIEKFSYKEIFFLCEILNRQEFVHNSILVAINNKICEDLEKYYFISPSYLDYIFFITLFIYSKGFKEEKLLKYLINFFLNKKDISLKYKYHYFFYLLILKKSTIPVEYFNFILKNIALFNYPTLYKYILIYFLKNSKNNYKFLLNKNKIKKKKYIKVSSCKYIAVNSIFNTSYFENLLILNENYFNRELLKIFLYLWSITTSRSGRKFIDLIIILNKFFDDKNVRDYLFNKIITKKIERYIRLLKNKKNKKYIILCSNPINKEYITFDIEKSQLLNRDISLKESISKNESDKISKIKNSNNYILNDYKYKKNIVISRDTKNTIPAKYLKNHKKGSPVQHFLSIYYG